MHTGKIGFELGFEQRINYQPDTLFALREILKDAEFTDASGIIWSQRIIKSADEIGVPPPRLPGHRLRA